MILLQFVGVAGLTVLILNGLLQIKALLQLLNKPFAFL
jgi:hypothetical protein